MTAIVFIGPMGAGKTSIGKRVAKIFAVPFIDTDQLVVRQHGPISEIFAAYGEAQFRQWEREAVADALSRGGVVALGGGAVLDEGTQRLLADHHVVLLTVTAGVIGRRIVGGRRPLLAGDDDPLERWRTIWEARRELYQRLADVSFDTSHRPMRTIAEEAAAWVAAHDSDGRFSEPAEGKAP